MNPAEIILFARGARAGGNSPFLQVIEKGRYQAYKDRGANSNFTGYDYETMTDSEIQNVGTDFNVDTIPQVIVMRDNEVVGRLKDAFITEQGVYEAIVKGVTGPGDGKPVPDYGSGGVVPVFNFKGLENFLSNALKQLLSDPRKLLIAVVIIAAITQKRRRRR